MYSVKIVVSVSWCGSGCCGGDVFEMDFKMEGSSIVHSLYSIYWLGEPQS
jgi:hypothetical protein